MNSKLIDDNDPIKKLLGDKEAEEYLAEEYKKASLSLDSISRLDEDLRREQDRRDRLRDDSDYRKVHEMMMEDEDYRNEQAKRDRAYEANIQIAKIMKEKLEKNLRNKNGDNLP